jgi:hypothetical protein
MIDLLEGNTMAEAGYVTASCGRAGKVVPLSMPVVACIG